VLVIVPAGCFAGRARPVDRDLAAERRTAACGGLRRRQRRSLGLGGPAGSV